MRALILGCAMTIAVGPAHAALNVFTTSLARQCYEAAMSSGSTGASLCERALASDELTQRDKAATLVNRGIIYNAARQLDRSIADFNAALAIDANLGEAYLNRGIAHFFRREFPQALADYSKAIDLKVGNLDYAHYDRALVYELLGKLDDAKADLKAALQINPEFKAATDRLTAVDQKIAAKASTTPPAEEAQPSEPAQAPTESQPIDSQ